MNIYQETWHVLIVIRNKNMEKKEKKEDINLAWETEFRVALWGVGCSVKINDHFWMAHEVSKPTFEACTLNVSQCSD